MVKRVLLIWAAWEVSLVARGWGESRKMIIGELSAIERIGAIYLKGPASTGQFMIWGQRLGLCDSENKRKATKNTVE